VKEEEYFFVSRDTEGLGNVPAQFIWWSRSRRMLDTRSTIIEKNEIYKTEYAEDLLWHEKNISPNALIINIKGT
jgi:hypothetical protein